MLSNKITLLEDFLINSGIFSLLLIRTTFSFSNKSTMSFSSFKDETLTTKSGFGYVGSKKIFSKE